jgi:Ca2+-binding RTX toxin-like protein
MTMKFGTLGATVVCSLAVGWSLPAMPGSADAAPARAATCGGRAATIVGTDQADALKGTPGRDVIAALGGNDTVSGLGGNDVLCGGLGRDRLVGGPGHDTLLGERDWVHVNEEGSSERVGDYLLGGRGDDRMLPGRDQRVADEVFPDTVSWEDAGRAVHIDAASGVATGEGRDRFTPRGAWLVGSSYGDTISGSRFRDQLSGGPGADRVIGRGGNDRIVLDPGLFGHASDIADGGLGDDTISAGGGEDVLRGGPGDDVLDDIGPAADRLYGGSGADKLFTQITDVPGVDQVVDGGPGAKDFVDLHTQTVNPTTEPSSAEWSMRTGQLVFTLDHPVSLFVLNVERVDLSAWGTSWTITGTPGPDRLSASGSWGTVFYGRGGDDTFSGSAYDDTFRGGSGSDHSPGMGVGTDTCSSVEVLDEPDCENPSP